MADFDRKEPTFGTPPTNDNDRKTADPGDVELPSVMQLGGVRRDENGDPVAVAPGEEAEQNLSAKPSRFERMRASIGRFRQKLGQRLEEYTQQRGKASVNSLPGRPDVNGADRRGDAVGESPEVPQVSSPAAEEIIDLTADMVDPPKISGSDIEVAKAIRVDGVRSMSELDAMAKNELSMIDIKDQEKIKKALDRRAEGMAAYLGRDKSEVYAYLVKANEHRLMAVDKGKDPVKAFVDFAKVVEEHEKSMGQQLPESTPNAFDFGAIEQEKAQSLGEIYCSRYKELDEAHANRRAGSAVDDDFRERVGRLERTKNLVHEPKLYDHYKKIVDVLDTGAHLPQQEYDQLISRAAGEFAQEHNLDDAMLVEMFKQRPEFPEVEPARGGDVEQGGDMPDQQVNMPEATSESYAGGHVRTFGNPEDVVKNIRFPDASEDEIKAARESMEAECKELFEGHGRFAATKMEALTNGKISSEQMQAEVLANREKVVSQASNLMLEFEYSYGLMPHQKMAKEYLAKQMPEPEQQEQPEVAPEMPAEQEVSESAENIVANDNEEPTQEELSRAEDDGMGQAIETAPTLEVDSQEAAGEEVERHPNENFADELEAGTTPEQQEELERGEVPTEPDVDDIEPENIEPEEALAREADEPAVEPEDEPVQHEERLADEEPVQEQERPQQASQAKAMLEEAGMAEEAASVDDMTPMEKAYEMRKAMRALRSPDLSDGQNNAAKGHTFRDYSEEVERFKAIGEQYPELVQELGDMPTTYAEDYLATLEQVEKHRQDVDKADSELKKVRSQISRAKNAGKPIPRELLERKQALDKRVDSGMHQLSIDKEQEPER